MALHRLKYTGTETDVILDKANSLIPGMVIMWYGDINQVPEGWALCNGSNGTPDLRNRFVVGAGSAYTIGNIGGSANVTLTVEQIPSHTHTAVEDGTHTHSYTQPSGSYYSGEYIQKSGSVSSTSATTGSSGAHTHTINATGGGTSHENRPPYYALAYIMKI